MHVYRKSIYVFLQLSKQDISSPTGTVGTLFTENGEEQMAAEEEPDMDVDRRVGYVVLPLGERLVFIIVPPLFSQFSCPVPEEGLAEQTKHARHRR